MYAVKTCWIVQDTKKTFGNVVSGGLPHVGIDNDVTVV